MDERNENLTKVEMNMSIRMSDELEILRKSQTLDFEAKSKNVREAFEAKGNKMENEFQERRRALETQYIAKKRELENERRQLIEDQKHRDIAVGLLQSREDALKTREEMLHAREKAVEDRSQRAEADFATFVEMVRLQEEMTAKYRRVLKQHNSESELFLFHML